MKKEYIDTNRVKFEHHGFPLDLAALNAEKISANSVKAINFDHHPDLNDKRFSENYIQMTAAATGEMVYDFLKSVNIDLSLAIISRAF